MSAIDWARVQALFAAAVDRPPEQRAAYLATAVEESEVRREVLSLLLAHEGRGRFDGVAERLRGLDPAEVTQLQAALADRYTVRRELGRGGMAIVYLATDLRYDRPVALKVLRPEIAAALGAERFLREISTTAQLAHPHIVSLLDSGDVQGRLFYVMSYVEGESLRERLEREHQLPLAEALQIAREVADALGYAHGHGVVHRDVKPENILLQSGHAVVADFGIAKAIDAAGGERLTATGVALGTPLYMSPEQAAGSRNVDGRSDLYSLGCVLYEMLAGHPPFQGGTAHEVLARHLTDPVPPLRTGRSTIPEAVAGAVERVLAKSPADRFRTAAEFSTALAGAGTQTLALAVLLGRPRRRTVVIAALVLATVFIVAAWWYTMGGGRRSAFATRRVVVAPFEDQTGDARLAQLGDLAADWITRRLSQASPSLEVMPATLVREAWQGTSTAATNHVHALAERTAARVVVSGTYSREGASVRFEAEIIDARAGRLITSIEPVIGPVERLNAIVGTLAERVTAAAAARLEPGVTRSTGTEENPPSLEAFREYQQGLEAFSRGDWEQSIAHFRRAMAIDSTYLSPVPWAATAYNNLGRWGTSDTLLRSVRSSIGHLTPTERINVEWLSAIVRGDREGQLRWAEEGFRLEPGIWAYPLGLSAVATNRPRKGLEVLARWDRETPFARNWIGYSQQLGNAHHLLGEYRAELGVARQWRERDPQQLAALALELRALAALGRLSEVDALVEHSASLPPQGQGPNRISAALVSLVTAQELRAHGFTGAATTTLDREIRQIERGALGDADNYVLGRALYLAGRWAEARTLFDSLHRGKPHNVDYLGFLGASYARLGDRQRAATVDTQLALVRQPYIRGRHTRWRAQIAALLGDRAGAVRLLRQADAEGAVVAIDLHRESDFESLRDYPPFQEFVRPRE